MDQFNKALSFILGLVVVAVFIVVASGKIKLNGIKLPLTKAKVSVTPTPSKSPSPTAKPISTLKVDTNGTRVVVKNTTPTPTYNPTYHTYGNKNVPTSIPNTGVPIILFPLLGGSMAVGIYLKSKSSKN